MLLFIGTHLVEVLQYDGFQYISCYCLSEGKQIRQYFIDLFQYISCYCLSVQTEIMQMQNTNFNTSHVTVYPVDQNGFCLLDRFQYISCYCLSLNSSYAPLVILEFQYISCYCLSKSFPCPVL